MYQTADKSALVHRLHNAKIYISCSVHKCECHSYIEDYLIWQRNENISYFFQQKAEFLEQLISYATKSSMQKSLRIKDFNSSLSLCKVSTRKKVVITQQTYKSFFSFKTKVFLPFQAFLVSKTYILICT